MRATPLSITLSSLTVSKLSIASKGPKHRWPWECYGLIGRIVELLKTDPSTSIRFITRKDNKATDTIARAARKNRFPSNWLAYLMNVPISGAVLL
ncbi:hypothetical protein LINPERHAP2_LOCUS33809 [Linum perenne]